ncbi:MAG: tetratricopeptide repeat protein [Candidatus Eisenbacteria bacterium]|nr:tetratricopeptide repeat protein [Candidatus Eisenbacteria bacterium]
MRPDDTPRASTPTRSPAEVLGSIEIASGSSVPGDRGSGEPGRLRLQDWSPIVGSLEWVLASRYWETEGLAGFIRSEVPYVINNTPWVAEGAARVVLAASKSLPADSPVRILELGAGIGLFASHFLRSFRKLCQEQGRDDYERTTYFVTDGSRRTARQWGEHGLFEEHGDHVVLAQCDANTPSMLRPIGEDAAPFELDPGSMHVVFANYVLDTLPATILKRDPALPDGFAEIRSRVYVSEAHRDEIRRRFGIDWDDLEGLATRACADEGDAQDALLPILPYLEFEVAFGERAHADPLPKEILDVQADRVVWNHGALEAMRRILSLLTTDGCLLIRDLGPATDERIGDLSYVARFGPSLAFTVAFPILDRTVAEIGWASISPSGDEERAIHTRLITRSNSSITTFRDWFADDLHERADALAEEATRRINAGRYADALEAYRNALELCPDDWHLLANAGQFLTQQLLRPQEAMELLSRALEIQPNFSAHLWNSFGNCHFVLGDPERAHACYLRAQEIHGADAQTETNLAYSWTALGRYEEALEAVAAGLYFDRDARFESALLTKQKEVLALLQRRREEEDQRADRRHEGFSGAR